MSKSTKNRPTEAELAILGVIWDLGQASVRQVQDRLGDQRKTGYTTTLKLMQIMLEKGLLQRDESTHAHIYRAAVTRAKTQKQVVSDLLEQVFEGSAHSLVMQALSSKKSSPAELAEIRNLLDKLERKSQ